LNYFCKPYIVLQAHEDLFFIDELGPLQVKRYGGRRYLPKHQTVTHP